MTDERASLNPRAIAPQLPGGAGPGPAPGSVAPAVVAMQEPSLVGQQLDGRYQVMQQLGEGMLTTVYEARHAGSGRHFAIKVLRAPLAAKPHILDRFLQQARAAAQLRHDNVVAIEEFGYTPTRSVYAAVELVVADTLQVILDRDGRWPWPQARPVALQIVAALKAAHAAGLVHRALKPANCFVVLDPKGKRDPFVKVADFGLAQVGVEANQADPGATTTTLYGDPEYMAPEQGFGGQSTPQTDIYAYGVLLYRMLAGRVPFTGPNPFQTISHHAQKPVPPLREADPQIPEAVEQLVMYCLAKTPEQRFSSAAQLEQALAAIPGHAQGGGQAQAQPPAAAPHASTSGPRFARFNAGGAGPAATPSKQPSVIVAGSLGDGGGGISGTLGSGEPAPFDPYASGPYAAPGAPYGPPPMAGHMPPPGPVGSSATLAPPAMLTPPAGVGTGGTSSFLASRPGLRMGLGAAVSGDGPAPPPTIGPGMAMPSPTIAPGSSPFTFGSDLGPPSYSPGFDASMAPPGAGPGYPPMAGGPDLPPHAAAPGYPPLGAGPGIPPMSMGPGMPPAGAGAGYPPMGAGPGMPPLAQGRGIPPVGAGAPPMGASPGYGAGPGMPPLGQGRGIPPVGAGMPPAGAGPGYPPMGVGPGMPPPNDFDMGSNDGIRRGVGPGMPPRAGAVGGVGPGVGPGMPMRRGPGIPPIEEGPSSGPQFVPSGQPETIAGGGLGAVEYDEEDQPKRRTWLLAVIGVVVILGGIGLALLIARGLEDPEGDVAKVTRTQKAQDVAAEPEPEPEAKEPEEPELEIEPAKVTKKAVPKKTGPTFEQSLVALKGRIRDKCKKVGAGPIDFNTFVDRAGGKANTPKVTQKSPVGTCALKIIQGWEFPASDEDHPVDDRVSW